MNNSTIIDLLGYLGGVFLMISFLPQVIKTWRTKAADQISILLLVMTLLSAIFYNLYAFLLGLTPVLIMNSIFFILVLVQLILTVKYYKTREEFVVNSNSELSDGMNNA